MYPKIIRKAAAAGRRETVCVDFGRGPLAISADPMAEVVPRVVPYQFWAVRESWEAAGGQIKTDLTLVRLRGTVRWRDAVVA